jgi:3-phosphoshikimate 1-carboxyvinyltransferase
VQPGLKRATLDGFGDHRIVMMQAIAGAVSQKGVRISGEEWAGISYPSFFEDLRSIMDL